MWKNIESGIKYDDAGVRAQYPNQSLLSFTESYLLTLGYVWEPEPPIVPAAITMRQARLVLLGTGLLASVDTAINSLPEPQKSAAKITWEYSTEVQRQNGLVSQLGPALGLTESQIDAMFIQGAAL